jgi:hypothetical protein
MPQESDIAIIVKFTDATNFPAALITGVINTIERVVFEVEREDLEDLIDIIENTQAIESIVADASRHRISAYRGQSVLVESARGGSIELICVAGALAYWILDRTIGETIKEAWRESSAHRRLKEFLSQERTAKAQEIARRLKRSIRAPRQVKELSLAVGVEVSEAGGISRIVVTVDLRSETQLPPTRSVVLSKEMEE